VFLILCIGALDSNQHFSLGGHVSDGVGNTN
jgi:hypothetical protein